MSEVETLLERWMPGEDPLRRHQRTMTLAAIVASLSFGARAGLLEALEEGGAPDALAARCGLDPRGTDHVLDLFAALGVTRVEGDVHRLHPSLTGDPFGLPLGAATAFWGELGPWLRDGARPGPFEEDTTGARAARYQAAVDGLARMFEPLAAELAARLAERGPAPARVLDVGAGSGVWGLAMAARHPETRVTALDLPGVLERARTRADALGLGDRLELVAGDLNEDPLPGGYDRVVLANALHLEAEPRARGWARAAAAAVAPGGHLVVVDALPSESPLDRVHAAAYAVHLGMRTPAGRPHPEASLRAWMEDAGLRALARVDLGGGIAALIGERPA